MPLNKKAQWRCVFLVAVLVAGLMLSLQATPSIAHTTAKAAPTHNCQEPSAYQPIRERGLKNEKRNAGSSRSCRHQPKAQERAADFWQSEEGRRLIEEGRQLDSNPNADACLTYEGEYIRQSKACPERV